MITRKPVDIKSKIKSPESTFNKKLSHMQEHIDKQVEIIASNEGFLEFIDKRDRETRQYSSLASLIRMRV